MISSIVSRLVILVFGTLYPAYSSYKAVRSRDVREYVKWMMYWIVFALFTCGETITDVFLSFWFPFYYEIKIGFVLWLLSPATKGSSILYRKFVHPMLTNREQEIDEYIARAKEQGYHTVLHLGSKGVNYATNVIMQTAIKSVEVAYKGGGGLVNQLRKSYSLSDLTEGEGEPVGDVNRNGKDVVDGLEYRGNRRSDRVDGSRASNRARGYSPRRSASGSARMEMYFPEVDLEVRQRRGSSRSREPSVPLSHIRSSEDVSYGNHYYEDASEMETDQNTEESGSLPVAEGPLVRTASVGSTRTTRTKGAVPRTGATSTTTTAAKKAAQGEDVEVSSSEEEDFWCDPADDFSPVPDRTIFVNDPSTFPSQSPHVAVESIVCSTDIVQLDIILGSTVSDLSGPIGLVENKIAEPDTVTESQPIKVSNPLSDVSHSLVQSKLNNSGMGDAEVAEISPVTPNEKSCSDHEACHNLLSGPIDDKIETVNASNDNQEDSKTMVILESPVLEVSHEQPLVNELSTQQIPSKVCEKIDTEESKEVSQMSAHVAGSDCTISKQDPDSISPRTSSEETRPDKSIVSLSSELVNQSKCLEEADGHKEMSEIKAGNSTFNENVTNSISNVMKEEQTADPRGGRYHKPPAPRPPQQSISSDASLESEKCEETDGGKSVHARLVLKPGIVRSLPDVNVASSSDVPIKSEVFMAVNSAPWSRLSSSPSPQASPKPSHKGKLLARSWSKGKADKGPEGSGFPRFLNMSGRPHLGSLTSIFPFWHGGSSSSGLKSDGKEEKKTLADLKGNESRKKEEAKVGDSVSDDVIADKSRGVKTERQFPVHQLSHSPTRYRANHKI